MLHDDDSRRKVLEVVPGLSLSHHLNVDESNYLTSDLLNRHHPVIHRNINQPSPLAVSSFEATSYAPYTVSLKPRVQMLYEELDKNNVFHRETLLTCLSLSDASISGREL